ncbi:ATP-dependent DNA helicase RecQ [Pontibacter ummariensis]|uniref:DNA helicase RecQ n=1 Tax=Pontibacter ummariensis TaxID=1610492 RepID=A0A239C8J7_9BACT|nr:DNA helicase RecQ [Pontibacter ummariensis]PRY15401.1 ATP-dependent DNA helicase RecQ [Pontibacter ummariensis]SNS16202.1 ATP-dependent DNA helicase RecQ [Pontibacter ummariensis]
MVTIREAREALKLYFGYEKFRPMQEQIIDTVLQQKDVVVLMPTGGGKSVCFQVPAVVLPGLCVVVSPLIALMKDQVEALLANGIPAAYLNSSLSAEQQYKTENECLEGKLKLLYVSPEKLLSSGFLSFLKRVNVSLFAVDEAHCISSWGHDFRPEYTQLKALKQQFPTTPVIALTATADKLTQKDIQEQLYLRDPAVFISSFDRPNINLMVKPGKDRFNRITDFLSRRHRQPGIVYCLSRKATESLANKLKASGYNATYYHAGMSAPQRARAQEAFLRDDVQIVCATIAFGMGIDKSNVRWVIHYNLPKNIEGYYQEIGRAGRDGASSEALLFYSFADVMNMRNMLQENESDQKQTELQLVKLERMQQFAEAAACRRRILLQYFGETMEKDCGNCDICRNPPTTFDGTLLAQKALSAVARTQEQANMGLLVDVLRGARNSQVLQAGFDKVKTYGAGRDVSTLDWNRYLHQMLNGGLLEMAYDQGYTLKLTEQSRQVLFEGRKVQLVKFEEVKQDEPAMKPRPKRELLKDALFERLRSLRKGIADEHGVPPYVVFTDTTLQEMAAERPTNKIAMLSISGVGAQKFERYGDAFITEIIGFINEEQQKGSKMKGATHLATLEMLQQGYSVEQIAKQRSLNPVTVYSHIATLYEQGYPVNLSPYVSKAEYKAISRAIAKLGAEAKLKDLYEALQEQYDYHKIRLSVSLYKKENTW